jgi:hypothetical protein
MIENVVYPKEIYMQKKPEVLKKYHQIPYIKPSNVSSTFRCDEVTQTVFCADVYKGRNIVMASRNDDGTKSNIYDVMST